MFIPKTIHRQREQDAHSQGDGLTLLRPPQPSGTDQRSDVLRPMTHRTPTGLRLYLSAVYLLCVPRFIQDLLAKECRDGRWQLNRCAG